MQTAHPLSTALAPRSVAVVGASERAGALGRYVLTNLLQGGYQGTVWPVNPKHRQLMGLRCYTSLEQLPAAPDLVVVATPARTVPGVIEAAGQCGLRAALVLSAGFAEAGPEGRALQAQMLAHAHAAGVRVIGPNCLGLLRPALGLNATFARCGAQAGSVALVAQSGAVVASALDYAASAGFGFSTVVSTGGSIDVDFSDVLDFLALDAQTRSIVLYIEGLRDARAFMSSVRAAASVKPVVVLKVGRHRAGSQAALSHTGALAGNDAVFDAALRQAGAIRVHAFDQLFGAAQTLAAGRLPQFAGPAARLAVLTNGGGPGVMAADAIADNGARGVALAALSDATRARLDALLPVCWSRGNPVDIVGDADVTRFVGALQALLDDDANDGVLVLFCPTIGLGAHDTAQALLPLIQGSAKPVIVAWLGGEDARSGRMLLGQARLPTAVSPERGVELFSYLSAVVRHQHLRLQVPPPLAPSATQPVDLDGARALIAAARGAGRVWLNELEAKQVLAAFGIPTAQTQRATTSDDAVACAQRIGFPVAVKILAQGVVHKSEVGGVMLALDSAQAVRAAFDTVRTRLAERAPQARFEGVLVQTMVRKPQGRELIAGMAHDPLFGPVLSFGSGGVMVEVQADTALALPPLNRELALDMMARTRVARALDTFRGAAPVDLDALIRVLLRLSDLACELPAVQELDINPLLADHDGVIALDARIRVAADAPLAPDLRYSHLAIHPYPRHLERALALKDGATVRLRPIRPEDGQAEARFISRLTPQTLYLRFHVPVKELTRDRLVRFTQIDYDREMAFVAIDTDADPEEIRAIARYTRSPEGGSCEFGLTVEDRWQRRGLGQALLAALETHARCMGVQHIYGWVLSDNAVMRQLLQTRGYQKERGEQGAGHVLRFGRSLSEGM